MFRNRCFDMGGQTSMQYQNVKMEGTDGMKQDNMNFDMPGVSCPPVYECPRENVCHRQIHHEVNHIIPVNTRIINHHIIHHNYTPMYTCCEENDCMNVYDNRCGM